MAIRGVGLLGVFALVAATVSVTGGADSRPLAAAPSPVASARATTTITIALGGSFSGYTPSKPQAAAGDVLQVVNDDRMAHTLTSNAVGPDGDPLFDLYIPKGKTRSLTLPTTLGAGKYDFYCIFHPNMVGSLTVTGGDGGGVPDSPEFQQALRIPPVMTGSDITIPMQRSQVQVMADGPKTRMWTYGGSFPGPTIKRPTGSRTRVTFVHRLPKRAGSLTVHQHGGHQSSRDDGQPTRYLIGPGSRRTYTYPLVDAGEPMPGGFRFYHDHRMDRTARNNWRGLQGMFLVTDPRERSLRLPRGDHDVPLLVADRSLDDDNQLVESFPSPRMHEWMTGAQAPPDDATVGQQILVNGQFAPYLVVQPGLYRLRLLNASLFSAYNFALSNGRPFQQVGTGSALLPRTLKRDEVLLGPAQRADVVVDFRGLRGEDVVLSTVARTDGSTGTGSRTAPLLQFRVRGESRQRARVPDRLRPVPPLAVPRKVSKVWSFGLTKDDHGSFWSIDGEMFDPDRVDHRVRQGSVERWRLRNTSDMTHYVHLHEEQWRTVSRNGGPPLPWERGFEDTWRLDPGEYVDVAARFTDHPGLFMVHCHMLDHEDHGMMAQFEVVRG